MKNDLLCSGVAKAAWFPPMKRDQPDGSRITASIFQRADIPRTLYSMQIPEDFLCNP
jgi:hypothetical protein